MVSYFAEYTDHSFYLLAALCLLADFYLLRKSGPLLCVGIGSLITGIFISLGWIEYYRVAFVMLAGFSCASGGLLWDYFKSQQEGNRPEKAHPMATSSPRRAPRATARKRNQPTAYPLWLRAPYQRG